LQKPKYGRNPPFPLLLPLFSPLFLARSVFDDMRCRAFMSFFFLALRSRHGASAHELDQHLVFLLPSPLFSSFFPLQTTSPANPMLTSFHFLLALSMFAQHMTDTANLQFTLPSPSLSLFFSPPSPPCTNSARLYGNGGVSLRSRRYYATDRRKRCFPLSPLPFSFLFCIGPDKMLSSSSSPTMPIIVNNIFLPFFFSLFPPSPRQQVIRIFRFQSPGQIDLAPTLLFFFSPPLEIADIV